MSAWDSMWKAFDKMMAALPGAIEEARSGRIEGVTVTSNDDGHLNLSGKFKSIRVNGYQLRVPSYVMRGEKKP